MSDPFANVSAYVDLPRLTGLVLHPDGSRLVAVLQEPDAKRSRYVSSLWEIPLDAGEPVRLTRSEKGESSPAFRPDGALLFTSARPDPSALWSLPPVGEACVLAHRRGGLGRPVVARESGDVVLTGARLVGSSDADDGDRRGTQRAHSAGFGVS